MNFEDEPYVRLYARDTKTWLRLGFEGQCVLMFLLRKLDKAGVLDGMDDLDSDVALITGIPEAIVASGMPRLLKWGVFQLVGNRLIMPNYIQAQSAIRTDKARQRDMREKRVAQARLVTPREPAVTERDESSREPTRDDAPSHGVTLYSADLDSAELCCVPDRAHPHVATPAPELEVEQEADAADEPAPDRTEIRPIASCGARTYSMPSEDPPQAYLDEALMGAVHPDQARSTWRHYWTEGLPEKGVEKLYPWLVQQALDFLKRNARVTPAARGSPGSRGSHNPRASKQPNAGLTGFEGLKEPA